MSTPPVPPPPATTPNDPNDPTTPERRLRGTAVVLAVLLLGAVMAWFAQYQTTLDEANKVRELRAERAAAWASDEARVTADEPTEAAPLPSETDRDVARLERHGYEESGHPGLFWRFTPNDERPGCSFDSCVFVDVTSTTAACRSVYLEGTTVDANDVVVGFANDRIGAVRPGDTARAEMTITEDDGTGVRLNKLSCR